MVDAAGRQFHVGRRWATNTTLYAEMDAYSYAGTAGQVISVSLAANGSGLRLLCRG